MGRHGTFDACEVAPDTRAAEGAIVYRKVMIGTGVGAAVVTAGYAVAAVMAIDAEIELPSRIGSICLTVILGLCLMSYTAWLVQRANLGRSADAIADAVAERLAERIETAVNAAGEKNHARTVTAFREIVTSELIQEELGAAVKKVFRYGMVAEAAGRADNVATLPRRN